MNALLQAQAEWHLGVIQRYPFFPFFPLLYRIITVHTGDIKATFKIALSVIRKNARGKTSSWESVGIDSFYNSTQDKQGIGRKNSPLFQSEVGVSPPPSHLAL